MGAQLQRQSASLGSLASVSASGTPRLSHLSTPSASLDKLQREDLLMHELDQVRPFDNLLTSHPSICYPYDQKAVQLLDIRMGPNFLQPATISCPPQLLQRCCLTKL